MLRGEGTWTRLKGVNAKAGEAVLVGTAVFERGEGGNEVGVKWWEGGYWGEDHAESGVETGVSGGVGAAEEEWEGGASSSRSMSRSMSSGSKASSGRVASPSTRTMWTASKCSRRAWRSLRWRPQQV